MTLSPEFTLEQSVLDTVPTQLYIGGRWVDAANGRVLWPPFGFPWTVGSTPEVRLMLIQYHWAQRAAMKPASWTLETTVRVDGEVVGCQSISTKDYLVTRTGETGSWLGMKHQGRGIGTMMGQAIGAFRFYHLGGLRRQSGVAGGVA